MNTPVIDFHNHVGRWGSFMADDDQESFIKVMDSVGIDKACVNCIFFSNATTGNDLVAKYVNRNPERFIGVAYVTPIYPNEAIPELDRAFDVLGMKFLKIYPNYLGKPVDDPAYSPIFEWANQRGIVVMSHASYIFDEPSHTRPKRFISLAQKYTNVKWVLAHSGNEQLGQIQAVEAARTCPNIYLETASSWGDHGTIEYLVEGAGEDRILYGSDMPLMDARIQVGRIITAQISDEAKRKILGLNAINLLGLDK